MKVHIVNHMSGAMKVHRAGCRDIAKDLRHANSDWTVDIPGKDVGHEVALSISDDFGWSPGDEDPQPWKARDLTVLPCTKGAHS